MQSSVVQVQRLRQTSGSGSNASRPIHAMETFPLLQQCLAWVLSGRVSKGNRRAEKMTLGAPSQ